MSTDELPGRDQILSGRFYRERRAVKLLRTIERRVAYLRTEARHAIGAYLLGEARQSSREIDFDYFLDLKRTVESGNLVDAAALERYTSQWQALVPPGREDREALLHLLRQRYGMDPRSAPQAYAALGHGGEADPRAAHDLPEDSQEAGTASAPEQAGALDEIESRVEWLHLSGGMALFQPGDPGDALYIVISGRLRATAEGDGTARVVADISQGEVVGETEILTGERRAAAVVAMRDSQLLRLPQVALVNLSRRYPQIVVHLNRIMANRLRAQLVTAGHPSGRTSASRLITLAVIPVGPDVALEDFTRALVAALAGHGPAVHLSARRLEGTLGEEVAQAARGHPDDARLTAWLSEQESEHRYVVYESDRGWSEWTGRCLRQADTVLVVAAAESAPERSEIERRMVDMGIAPRTEVVLLHPERAGLPQRSARWLTGRDVQALHHVRQGDDRDVQRLARRVTGRGIGLVLSGGGARGFAHIGVIRALEEAGIPVDIVGSASMGALIGGGFARGYTSSDLLAFAQRWGFRRRLLDPTLPLASMTAGRKLTALLHEAFGETAIEDCPRSFFCITTDMTIAEQVVQDHGPVWRAVRASLAIPIVYSPVIDAGHVLVDGGLINNFPLDIMRDVFEAGTVIGVNLSPLRESVTDYECDVSLSGWNVLRGRLGLASQPSRAPSVLWSLMRTIEVNGVRRMKSPGFLALADLLIEPPVSAYGLLDFSSHDAIVDIGYQAGCQALERWQGEDRGASSIP